MHFSICAGSAKNLFFSTPIKCGISPNWYIGAMVVEKVKLGVIISDPFLKLKEDRANEEKREKFKNIVNVSDASLSVIDFVANIIT